MLKQSQKRVLFLTLLLSHFSSSQLLLAKNFNDFSPAFLLGMQEKVEPIYKAIPLENSLEYVWQNQATIDPEDDFTNERQYELYLKTEYELAANRNHRADSTSKLLHDLNPPSPAHAARARLLFDSGKFFELIQLPFFSQIEHSQDWETMLMGARAYEMIGMLSKAEKLFDKAMEKHSDKEQLIYHRIMLEIKRNNLAAAEQIIDNFLKNNNKKARHSIFYQLKAAIKLQDSNANPTEALDAINKSLTLNPRSEKALKIKLVALEQLKAQNKLPDQQDLIETYKQIALVVEDVNFKKAIVDKLFKAGYYEFAYQQLCQINEQSPENQFDLALLAFKSKQFATALKHIQTAITNKPHHLKNILLKLEILAQHDSELCANFAIELFGQIKYQKIATNVLFRVLNKVADPQPILQLFLQQKQRFSNKLHSLLCLAECYWLLSYHQQALALYQQAETMLDVNKSSYPYLRSKINYNLCLSGLFVNNAPVYLAKIKELMPLARVLPEICHLAAVINFKQKKPLEGLKFAALCVGRQPFNLAALNTLSHGLMVNGKLYQALKIGLFMRFLDPIILSKGLGQELSF